MDNWLIFLRAVGGILSAAAATATLINTLVSVRRGHRRKAESSISRLARVSIRGWFVHVAGERRRRAKKSYDAEARLYGRATCILRW